MWAFGGADGRERNMAQVFAVENLGVRHLVQGADEKGRGGNRVWAMSWEAGRLNM